MQARSLPLRRPGAPALAHLLSRPRRSSFGLPTPRSRRGFRTDLVAPVRRAPATSCSTPLRSCSPSSAPTLTSPRSRLRETAGEARELLLAKPTKENEAKLDTLLRESLSSRDD